MAINTWDGAVDTDWNDAGNWNTTGVTDRVPTADDDVVIANVSNNCVMPDGLNPTINSLFVESSASLTAGNNNITIDSHPASGTNRPIDLSGTFVKGTSTLTFTYSAAETKYLNFRGVEVHNVVINGANTTFAIGNGALTASGNLTITAGTLDTFSAQNNALTVTGELYMGGGTLTCNASDVIVRNIYGHAGTLSAPSNSSTNGLEITGKQPAGGLNNSNYSIYFISTTLTNNDGLIVLSADENTFIRMPQALGNFKVRNDGSSTTRVHEFTMNFECDHNLTLENGTLQSYGATQTLTVGDDVLLTKGTLGRASNTSAYSFGSLTIAADGIYLATSGTTTLKSETSGGSTYVNDGTFTHNNGTLLLHADIPDTQVYAGSSSLYNVTSSTGNNVWLKENITIANDLTITSGTFGSGGGNDKEVTVHGNVFISGGEFGNGSETGAYTVKGLVTLTGGTFDLSSGTINLGGIRNVGGTIQ